MQRKVRWKQEKERKWWERRKPIGKTDSRDPCCWMCLIGSQDLDLARPAWNWRKKRKSSTGPRLSKQAEITRINTTRTIVWCPEREKESVSVETHHFVSLINIMLMQSWTESLELLSFPVSNGFPGISQHLNAGRMNQIQFFFLNKN